VDEIREGAFYMGPKWYWKVNYSAIIQFGHSKRGEITTSDVLCTLTASQHEPAYSLVAPYKEIESIVTEALYGCDNDTIKRAYKNLILCMQGGWTKQHTYKWNCVDSHCEDDAKGPVLRTRRNPDGTTCYQSRIEIISNQSMFAIGRIPLDIEHLQVFRLMRALKYAPHTIHGAVNDCLRITTRHLDKVKAIVEGTPIPQTTIEEALGTTSTKQEYHPPFHRKGNEFFYPASGWSSVIALPDRSHAIPEERDILQHPSGAPIFKIERLENGHLKTPTAPDVAWLYAQDPPSEPS
jgi:hypothetical protein